MQDNDKAKQGMTAQVNGELAPEQKRLPCVLAVNGSAIVLALAAILVVHLVNLDHFGAAGRSLLHLASVLAGMLVMCLAGVGLVKLRVWPAIVGMGIGALLMATLGYSLPG